MQKLMLENDSLKAKNQYNEGWKEARSIQIAETEKALDEKLNLIEKQKQLEQEKAQIS